MSLLTLIMASVALGLNTAFFIAYTRPVSLMGMLASVVLVAVSWRVLA